MLGIYLTSLIVGGTIVGLSAIAGGHDADADVDHDFDMGHDVDIGADVDIGGDMDVGHDMDMGHDMDHDMDADGDVDHGGDFGIGVWSPFWSMRFWTFFMAFFGLTGTVFEALTLSGALVTSIIVGLFCGYTAAVSVKLLQRATVSSLQDVTTFKGKIGKVILDAPPGERGRIRISDQGQSIDLGARMHDPNIEMLKNSMVVVLSVQTGMAEVMPCPEEMLSDLEPGSEKEKQKGSSEKSRDATL